MPILYKQAHAIVDDRTTVVCLDVHGIAVEVDAPFETLAGDFQSPPFHVHCRTLVYPFLKGFVSQARKEANAELMRRPMAERRKGPGGEVGGTIPGPVTKNPPSGFSRKADELAAGDHGGPMALYRKAEPASFNRKLKVPDVPNPLSEVEASATLNRNLKVGTKEQHRVAGLYLSGARVNGALRSGDVPDSIREQVKTLTAFIMAQPAFGAAIRLYRGMSSQFLPDAEIGMVIKDPAFMSTSLKRSEAENFAGGGNVLLEIITRAEDHGLSMNMATMADQSQKPDVMKGEAEILLPPGTALQVVSVEERQGPNGLYTQIRAVIVDG